jgi:hypothetical protein
VVTAEAEDTEAVVEELGMEVVEVDTATGVTVEVTAVIVADMAADTVTEDMV